MRCFFIVGLEIGVGRKSRRAGEVAMSILLVAPDLSRGEDVNLGRGYPDTNSGHTLNFR